MEKFKESYDESGDDVIYVVDADDRELGDTLKAEVLELYPNRTVRRCTSLPYNRRPHRPRNGGNMLYGKIRLPFDIIMFGGILFYNRLLG